MVINYFLEILINKVATIIRNAPTEKINVSTEICGEKISEITVNAKDTIPNQSAFDSKLLLLSIFN